MIGFVHDLNHNSTAEKHNLTCFYAEVDKTQLYEDQVKRLPGATVIAQKSAEGLETLDLKIDGQEFKLA